jgi:hypothetical protein
MKKIKKTLVKKAMADMKKFEKLLAKYEQDKNQLVSQINKMKKTAADNYNNCEYGQTITQLYIDNEIEENHYLGDIDCMGDCMDADYDSLDSMNDFADEIICIISDYEDIAEQKAEARAAKKAEQQANVINVGTVKINQNKNVAIVPLDEDGLGFLTEWYIDRQLQSTVENEAIPFSQILEVTAHKKTTKDIVTDFVNACFDFSATDNIGHGAYLNDVYRFYTDYCKANNYTPLKDQSFRKYLRKLYPDYVRTEKQGASVSKYLVFYAYAENQHF